MALMLLLRCLRSHRIHKQLNCGRRNIFRDTKALGTCYYIMLESGGTEGAASFNAGVLPIKQANGVSSNENMFVVVKLGCLDSGLVLRMYCAYAAVCSAAACINTDSQRNVSRVTILRICIYMVRQGYDVVW